MNRFKDTQQFGGWLNNVICTSVSNPNTPVAQMNDTTSSTISRQNTLSGIGTPSLGDLPQFSTSSFFSSSISAAELSVVGFQTIEVYFADNADLIELYFVLFALLFDAQHMRQLPSNVTLDLNVICLYVFDKSFDSEQTLFSKINSEVAVDVSIILLGMVRTLMNDKNKQRTADANNNAIILLQSKCSIFEVSHKLFISK